MASWPPLSYQEIDTMILLMEILARNYIGNTLLILLIPIFIETANTSHTD